MLKKALTSLSTLVVTVSLLTAPAGVSQAATPISNANSTIFGPNVYVFDSSMAYGDIQNTANSVFSAQESSQFGNQRTALLFKPGSYSNTVRVGFYTQVAGLGQNPDDVTINGGVNADAQWDNANSTLNFWRSIENISVNPTSSSAHVSSGTAQWAVSQAAPMRRVHIKGNLFLFDFDNGWNAGWASGGFNADTVVDGKITPASQQQWISRNSKYGSWANGVWNMVFVGDQTPPSGAFPNPPYTVVDQTPVMREKPYLYTDNSGNFNVFVPSLQTNKKGVTWATGATPGTAIPISQFYIAQPGVSAATLNSQLSQGKNLIFTPGIYHLSDTLQVTHANTVVMGLGFATLIPDTGKNVISVADVDGVSIAGLIFDAGANGSPALLQVGPAGSAASHATNPTALYDLSFRVGGAVNGKTDTSLLINSNDVIGDDLWIWRADHGAGAGWSSNTDKNGLVVNGGNVTMYGLFNEHHQEYQTLWNGNGGRVYFYQSEIPYDVPNQASWMSKNNTVNGYASYKVADNVTSHEAWGVGVYSFFRDAAVKLNSAIEVPDVQGVNIHHMTTIWLSGMTGSEISHVINNTGSPVYANSPSTAMRQTVSEFAGSGTPSGDTVPPTAPTGLTATAASSTAVQLAWSASTDNVGVSQYVIYRNGAPIATTAATSYQDSGLTPSTSYSYTVVAKDAAGNTSSSSNTATAVTSSGALTALDRSNWTLTTSPVNSTPANMIDGSLTTRWTSGKAQAAGQSVTIDMGSAQNFSQVVMDATNSSNDYARGYEIYVSGDGVNWGSAVASGSGSGAVITANFAAKTARYIKIVQTGTDSHWWSIAELNVYGQSGTPTQPTALARTGWTAVTNPVNGTPGYLFDADMSTRWTTGKNMAAGQSIVVDMTATRTFNRVVMDSTGSNNDYARGYEIYVSADGVNWGSAVASGTGTGPVVAADFTMQSARYLKVVQTGTASNWWSVRELNVYQ
ncbi:discoidin domain-containing protein [Paenibacillus athensensis]|uniref:Coagulation factor 5/8 type domain protein n=1 Tax=Paenibacillus athensensis TaxID=1967502 RepID=A0A4Y8Q666_9BACL|nr:discoidin domain-containing protein [Paenibacillus athensensis]MCD1259538.1 discoidin domain-containing protein [Paenibacillus athensensis]